MSCSPLSPSASGSFGGSSSGCVRPRAACREPIAWWLVLCRVAQNPLYGGQRDAGGIGELPDGHALGFSGLVDGVHLPAQVDGVHNVPPFPVIRIAFPVIRIQLHI